MTQPDIGFHQLLERLLPLEELQPTGRSRVLRAHGSGLTREIESAALATLARLVEEGALRRAHPAPDRGRAVTRVAPPDVRPPRPEGLTEAIAYPRAALPARAVAGLDQVRQLLRLDDPTLVADPGETHGALLGQVEQAGRELLAGSRLVFHALPPRAKQEEAGEDPEPRPAPRPLDRSLVDQALAQPGAVLYCPDAARLPRLAAEAAARGARSLALAAVVAPAGTPRGTLEVLSPAPAAYRLEDLARVALLADYCGGLLERAERIEKLVYVDPLTGVYNRAHFDQQARNELARARREQTSVALCIVDIDNFKSFNSAFGYEAGNQVLIQVAQTLRRGVRPFDTVARWGGEEFAVLLAAPVQADAARAISERLRGSVERLRVRLEGLDQTRHEVAVTVSIGVALFPEHVDAAQDLWRAANRALLSAKAGRKNEVIFFQPPPRSPA